MTNKLLIISVLFVAPFVQAQQCNENIPASTPIEQFTINGDEVIDQKTGLIWSKCPVGFSGDTCTGTLYEANWQDALEYAQDVRTATGKKWRLPNIKELRSIVEIRCDDPTINASVFPITTCEHFWSSSPDMNDIGVAWYIYFKVGRTPGASMGSRLCFRLVRDPVDTDE